MLKLVKRWGLLVFLLGMLSLFFYFDLGRYLSFESIKSNREFLVAWTDRNFIRVLLGFMLVYTITVASSVPGAAFLTITAGFLFGPIFGTLAVIFSATLGAFIVYLAVELALRDWVVAKAGKWVQVMEEGFRKNEFSYLLFIRLIPLFPFWLVNIVPALLGISKWSFVFATFLGIIPGTFVYALVGNGLGHVFDAHETPSLAIIFDPKILLPIIALGLLSLLPILYKSIKRKQSGNAE